MARDNSIKVLFGGLIFKVLPFQGLQNDNVQVHIVIFYILWLKHNL